jgi:molybdopterin synthase catalytic subunit
VALLHRIGTLAVGEVSVVVVVSAPHRPEAFAAAAFGIDAIKASVPIWKLETWEGGRSFSECVHPLTVAGAVPGPSRRAVAGAHRDPGEGDG